MLASYGSTRCCLVCYPFIAVSSGCRYFFCFSGCIADCTFLMSASCGSTCCFFVCYPFIAVSSGCRDCFCFSSFFADCTFLMLASCGSTCCFFVCYPFVAVLTGCRDFFCLWFFTASSCAMTFLLSIFSAGCFFCNCPVAPLMSECRELSYSFFLVFMCFTFFYEFSGFFTGCFCAFNNFPHTVTWIYRNLNLGCFCLDSDIISYTFLQVAATVWCPYIFAVFWQNCAVNKSASYIKRIKSCWLRNIFQHHEISTNKVCQSLFLCCRKTFQIIPWSRCQVKACYISSKAYKNAACFTIEPVYMVELNASSRRILLTIHNFFCCSVFVRCSYF